MQLSHAPHRRPVLAAKPSAERQLRSPAAASEQAAGEISAYIALRDRLLEKAEGSRTESNLDRVASANEFVENCLRPARAPYAAQHLPPAEAACERQRCEAVRLRLAHLRATFAQAA